MGNVVIIMSIFCWLLSLSQDFFLVPKLGWVNLETKVNFVICPDVKLNPWPAGKHACHCSTAASLQLHTIRQTYMLALSFSTQSCFQVLCMFCLVKCHMHFIWLKTICFFIFINADVFLWYLNDNIKNSFLTKMMFF